MRIDAVNRLYGAYETQAVKKVSSKGQVAPKDEVTLSVEGKDIIAVQKMLKEVPDVREDRVKELKERIASGNYNVSSKEVADKILSSFSVRG